MEAPKSIFIIEKLDGVTQKIETSLDSKYQAVLVENTSNSIFIFPQKFIKILLVRCWNVKIILCESLLSTLEIFESEEIQFNVFKEVPIITIENSRQIEILANQDLQILNSYSNDIYINWIDDLIEIRTVKMPLIMFSNHWLWSIPCKTHWDSWSRQEIKYLINDNILHIKEY